MAVIGAFRSAVSSRVPGRVPGRATQPYFPGIETVQLLAGGILFAMMMLTMIGIPSLSRGTMQEITSEADTLSAPLWILLLALCVPVLWIRRVRVLQLGLAMWPLIILTCLFALSTQWALDPAASLRRVLRFVITLGVVFGVVTGIDNPRALHLTVVAACILCVALEALVTVAMPGFAMMDDGLAALHTTKNLLGLVLLYSCMALGVSLVLVKHKIARFAIWGTLAVGMGLMALTRSTTSQALVIVSAGLIPLIVVMARLEPKVRWALLIGVIAVLFTLAFVKFSFDMMNAVDPLALMRGVTFTERTDIWEFLLGEIAKRPMLGAGYGSFWQIDPNIQPSLQTDAWYATAGINEGHDGYLDVIVANGFVGFGLVLFVLSHAFRLAVRAVGHAVRAVGKTESITLAAFQLTFLVVFCIHNVTESSLFFNTSTLGNLFLLCVVQLQNQQLARADAIS